MQADASGGSAGAAASSLNREALIRLREQRRAKQALIARGPRQLVEFDEFPEGFSVGCARLPSFSVPPRAGPSPVSPSSSPSFSSSSPPPPLRRPPARVFRNLYVAQVGPFMFRLLHRLEGRWTGEAEVHVAGVATAMPDVRVCTVQRE
jgi:hypothetical protein